MGDGPEEKLVRIWRFEMIYLHCRRCDRRPEV